MASPTPSQLGLPFEQILSWALHSAHDDAGTPGWPQRDDRSPRSPVRPASRLRLFRRSSTAGRTSHPRPAPASRICCARTATAAGAPRPPAPLIDLVFHELESAWAMEVIRGVENIAREEGLSVVLSESAGGSRPGQGRPGRPRAARTGVLGPSRARRVPARPADQRAASRSWSRPGRRPRRRRALDRRHQLAGRPGRHPPSDRTRPPPHRRHQRAPDDVQPRPGRRLPGRSGDRRAAGRPRPAQARRLPPRDGLPAGPELLRCPDRPTAVFAGNDLQALGLYEAARELGLRIPEDLSVVGFDDLPVARWVGPPLTTVRQPLMEMAEAAAQLVVGLARGEEPPQTRGSSPPS